VRRYRVWAGSPEGTPEDPTRCIAEVADGGRSPLFHQCGRLRVRATMMCSQHLRQRDDGKHVYIPRDQ